MALTDEQRQALLASTPWSFSAVEMRAQLIDLGIADGKTFADAITYANQYGAAFSAKEPLERKRIEDLVDTGATGVLDALTGGDPALHTLLGADDMSVLQFEICKYLLQNGDSLADAITGAVGVVGTDKKTEAVLYFLLCGQDLATAKTSAGL